MNLDRLQVASALPRAAVGPAALRTGTGPGDVAQHRISEAVGLPDPSASPGEIQGVLTPEENRTIADLFGRTRDVYTLHGHTRTHRVTPGMYLDVRV